MAEPKTAVRKSLRPRTVKDKQIVLLFKGNIEAVEVCFDPWEAMERKENDPSWSYKKITIPVNRRAPGNQGVTL